MNIKFNYPFKTRSDFLQDVVKRLIKRILQLGMTKMI